MDFLEGGGGGGGVGLFEVDYLEEKGNRYYLCFLVKERFCIVSARFDETLVHQT